MAKRDQLYTVNKWNKPFFEDEQRRRKKLYGIGGNQNDTWGFNPYVSTGNDIDVFGYGKKAGIGTVMRLPYVATQDAFVGNPYTRTNHTLDMNAVQISKGLDNPMYAPDTNTEDKSASESKSSASNTVGNILNTISNVADAAKTTSKVQGLFIKDVGYVGTKADGTPFKFPISNIKTDLPPYAGAVELSKDATKHASDMIAKDIADVTKITKGNITPLGKAGINLGASVLGNGAKYLLSNGLSTGVGEGIGTIADAASTVVQFIPGVGWAAAPIISFAGNALAGAWNGAFGSKTFDNGATAYTNRLNAINPNGSNEYIANLLASTGLGPRATYKDGWLRDKGKNEAAEINNTQDLAFNRFQRGARDAILNNNFLQTQYALNDTWSAMGGKLNRKKCNCKATGGVLNSALINSATPSGYDILKNFADIEDMKNQNSKDMNSTMGNSFMNIGGNNLFPYGGNINPLLQELMTVKPISNPEPLNLDKVLGRGDYKQYGVYPLKEVVVTGERPSYALTEDNEYPIPARYIPQSEVTAKYADSPMEAYDNSVLLESNGLPLMSGYVKVAMEPGHTRTNGNISGKQYMKGNSLYDYNTGDTILDYTDNLTETGNALGQKLMGLPLHAADAILGYPRRHWMKNGRYYEPFASGGPMIKPSHRGRLTELKKRTGKTEAELYNDGNPAHKKMVTFARNARKWKKAYGGFLDAVDNLSEIEKALYGNRGTSETRDKDNRDNFFLGGQNRYDIGGVLQSAGSNWGNVSEINAGGQHEENPYQGVQVGVDPEGTPNLVEENEVIWNDYVFSNRIKVPKEVCKRLRIGQKKNGFTFADAAKKLLVESKERPNDPISKKGLEANMQLLEGAQEEVKKKMEAEQAVEQFNNLPPEQQVAIMNQEGERAQDAVAQEQMAQEIQNLPPEQQLAIAQQMAAEQALAQGVPLGQPSPEEQAMMQQQMAQQQMPQSNINPQEALAQAAAMQQQAINGSAYGGKLCFGGRKFAEGGELTELPQAEPEAAVQTADSEMAKYSDEELQDMIEDYQEAESGEVKVTKGKLARLKKKAEKAERELERRHSEENAEQPQEERREPSQEEIQAAAQALAQQQMMEGQPQEGMSLEGMSPEQAMMMQQQMGQPQMSPEEMAMSQQQGGQYAYGGKLYLTGGELAKMLGFSNTADAPFTTKDLGIENWYDEIPEGFDFTPIYKKLNDPTIDLLVSQGWTPFGRREEIGDWYEPTNGSDFDWTLSGERFKNNGYTYDDLAQLVDYYPYMDWVLNTGLADWEWSKHNVDKDTLMNLIRQTSEWNRTDKWLRDSDQGLQRRLDYIARRRGLDPKGKDKRFLDTWNKFGDFTQEVDEQTGKKYWKYNLKKDKQADFDKEFWRSRGDGVLGTMYDVLVPPKDRSTMYVLDKDGKPTGHVLTGDTSGYEQVGPSRTFYTEGKGRFDPKYNNTISFWKQKDTTATTSDKNNESNYLTVGWKPKTNWTDYMLGALPGLTGLGMMLAQGKPDMSGIEAAANAYASTMGALAPIHLTHGLMKPDLTDIWNNHNILNASRLGTNRLLRNTGPAPSQSATIMANDARYQLQLGQNDLRDIAYNAELKKAAATFNEGVARANAQFLNQGDQFNAQMLANAGERYAQLRYNDEKEKLDQENAWRAGILGNIGSAMTGIYNAYREGQNRNERDLLAASGVFGNTNGLLDNYYGISKVDPKTGKVVRGPYTDWYWYDNDFHKQPQMAIGAKGGKLNRKSKKRKGYTF